MISLLKTVVEAGFALSKYTILLLGVAISASYLKCVRTASIYVATMSIISNVRPDACYFEF